MNLAEFNARRVQNTTQMFHQNAPRTVMLCSHIWWTEHMALALINLGYNVLIHNPLYLLYTEDSNFDRFDELWEKMIAGIRQSNVSAIIGGNAAAIAPHPRTGELLHHALGIPLVNYWWDEPRSEPPFARRGFDPDAYVKILRDPRTLNVIWDADVLEEMRDLFAINNSLHLPLACCPDFWPDTFIPLEQRPLLACFLGNCHFEAAWVETDRDPLVAWARAVIDQKQATMDTSMAACIAAAGAIPTETRHLLPSPNPVWRRFVLPWEILNSVWMHRTRNLLLQAAATALQGRLALIGKGWEQLGLRANSDHAREKSGLIYAQSKASLNLFGGCVHGGMPLRPFDITASNGLLLTHYQRELPTLFDPATECLSFKSAPELLDTLDRITTHPADFNPLVHAAHRRTRAHHTWENRMQRLMAEVNARFG